jgi:DNA primase
MADFELSRDVVDQVREAADAAEVVGEQVRLKRRGRKYVGLCPFHDEKTPSFSVDPDRGLYYCFGCHQGGDIFKFVMQTEGLSFPEAVERLARRYGVKLPPRSPEARRRSQEADKIRGVLEEAQAFFVDELSSAAGAEARRELERRGFDRSSWQRFGFGWAADEWRRLTDSLGKRHTEGGLIASGLTVQRDSGGSPYDRFRSRITFPIRSADGRLIGFGGRILGSGEPKYLNSPESVLFRKRSTLFSLDLARPAIRSSQSAVVVEGYFDCLSLHRVGIDNVVATLGTALTSDHARMLRRDLGAHESSRDRYPTAMLCYDADDAGRRAAMTGIRVLLEAGVGVAVVELAEGTDPDDLIRQGGADAARELLDRPTSVMDFLLSALPSKPADRQRAGAEVAELIASAGDPHTRNELMMELSVRLGFSAEVLRDLGRKLQPQTPGSAPAAGSAMPSGEEMLARIVLEGGPEWRSRIAREVEPSLRRDSRLTRLLEALRSFEADEEVDDDFYGWLRGNVDDPELTALLARVATTEAPELSEEAIRKQFALTLSEQRRGQARQLTEAIRKAEQAGDEELIAQLQGELRRLRS